MIWHVKTCSIKDLHSNLSIQHEKACFWFVPSSCAMCHVIAEASWNQDNTKEGGGQITVTETADVMEVMKVWGVGGCGWHKKKWAASVEWWHLNAVCPRVGVRTGLKRLPYLTNQYTREVVRIPILVSCVNIASSGWIISTIKMFFDICGTYNPCSAGNHVLIYL